VRFRGGVGSPGPRDDPTGRAGAWTTTGRARRLRAAAWWSLVVVSAFNALSAVGGGLGMVLADGLSMPKSLLADTPFSTFAVPGLILTLVVGGTQATAVWQLLTRRESALLWSAVAGFGMLIWIVTEIIFLQTPTNAQLISFGTGLQVIYLVTGLVQLILVFSLLGIVTWLPRLDPSRTRPGPPRAQWRRDSGQPIRGSR
jgi:hypothetical protein